MLNMLSFVWKLESHMSRKYSFWYEVYSYVPLYLHFEFEFSLLLCIGHNRLMAQLEMKMPVELVSFNVYFII